MLIFIFFLAWCSYGVPSWRNCVSWNSFVIILFLVERFGVGGTAKLFWIFCFQHQIFFFSNHKKKKTFCKYLKKKKKSVAEAMIPLRLMFGNDIPEPVSGKKKTFLLGTRGLNASRRFSRNFVVKLLKTTRKKHAKKALGLN